MERWFLRRLSLLRLALVACIASLSWAAQAQPRQIDFGSAQTPRQPRTRQADFGAEEILRQIQRTEIRDQNGERLYLGFKISLHAFLMNYTLTDDGYILGVEGRKRYYALTPERRDLLQAQGLLPKPLPPYQIPWLAQIFGHTLWIVLGLLAAFALYLFHLKRQVDADEALQKQQHTKSPE